MTSSFVDTPADYVASDSLLTFFENLPELCETDYMFFQILGDPGEEGAWCSERGDWYVDTYIEQYGNSPTLNTELFFTWFREGTEDQPWEEGIYIQHQNHYGGGCGTPGAWCSNWGLGGLFLGVIPQDFDQIETGAELRLSSSFISGDPWELTLRWGRSREAACGF